MGRLSMKRNFPDWLNSFVDYAATSGEAPRRMYFWAGVSAVAGALRRRVWIEQRSFRWYANFYIVFVAPPGVVSKSTTVDVAIKLLRRVEGIKFGPDVVTWQALVQALGESAETFLYNGDHHTMSAVTLEASEFGNLLNPQDREMVDAYVRLWDAKESPFEKRTKHSGNDTIHKPWINMIACTTPAWIAGNFPEYMIGGGFTSRCVFVYAEKKDMLVPYPDEVVIANYEQRADELVQDLNYIAQNLVGEFKISEPARVYGRAWYEEHHTTAHEGLDNDRFGGYLARKQTIIHKLAMILSASRHDTQIIEVEDLALANTMVTDLEADMAKVFARIGQAENAAVTDRLLAYIRNRGLRGVPFNLAFQYVHAQVPSLRDFEDLVHGCVRAGYIQMVQSGTTMTLIAMPEFFPVDSMNQPILDKVPGDKSESANDAGKDGPQNPILPSEPG
jgi:uncharacterized protein DUF3987